MEARLFPEGTIPWFTTDAFFAGHDWIPPAVQTGHSERQRMVIEMVKGLQPFPHSATDLGAGDGSLVGHLSGLGIERVWGYDLGEANRKRAAECSLDVRPANIVDGVEQLELGELVTCTEVIEHLLDPHGWLRSLRAACASVVIFSSPSSETAVSHYEHHAWAWDLLGYAQLLTEAGWSVLDQRECSANDLRFQAVAAS